MFAALFSSSAGRDRFIARMCDSGITCTFHYVPLHDSPFGRHIARGAEFHRLPGCDLLSSNIVRFPIYYNMTDAELEYVVEHAMKHIE